MAYIPAIYAKVEGVDFEYEGHHDVLVEKRFSPSTATYYLEGYLRPRVERGGPIQIRVTSPRLSGLFVLRADGTMYSDRYQLLEFNGVIGIVGEDLKKGQLVAINQHGVVHAARVEEVQAPPSRDCIPFGGWAANQELAVDITKKCMTSLICSSAGHWEGDGQPISKKDLEEVVKVLPVEGAYTEEDNAAVTTYWGKRVPELLSPPPDEPKQITFREFL